MSEITKDQLEECGWKEATHTIMPDGGIGEITKYGLEYNGTTVPFASSDTWGALGFTAYRKKQERLYTFEEAVKEPGIYAADTKVLIYAIRVSATNFALGVFEEGQFTPCNPRFDRMRLLQTYRKVSE